MATAPLRIKLTAGMGKDFRERYALKAGRVADAARYALFEARARILEGGRADMKTGGNFGSDRWQKGLQGTITPEGVRTANLTLTIIHTTPFALIHEYGGVINGKPLLWIPLPWSSFKGRAKDYPGKLFRVDRKKKGKNPLLLTYTGGRPVYVGVKSVKLKRRWHIRPIIRSVARQVPGLFQQSLKRL